MDKLIRLLEPYVDQFNRVQIIDKILFRETVDELLSMISPHSEFSAMAEYNFGDKIRSLDTWAKQNGI